MITWDILTPLFLAWEDTRLVQSNIAVVHALSFQMALNSSGMDSCECGRLLKTRCLAMLGMQMCLFVLSVMFYVSSYSSGPKSNKSVSLVHLQLMHVFNKAFVWLGWCTLFIVWCLSGLSIRTLRWCFRRRWRRYLPCVRSLSLLWLMKTTSWSAITDNPSPVLFWPVHLTQELHAVDRWNQEVLFFYFSLLLFLPWSGQSGLSSGYLLLRVVCLVCLQNQDSCFIINGSRLSLRWHAVMCVSETFTVTPYGMNFKPIKLLQVTHTHTYIPESPEWNMSALSVHLESHPERLQAYSQYEAPSWHKLKSHEELKLSTGNPLLSKRRIGSAAEG